METDITTRQVADLLGISCTAVDRLSARGTLPYRWFSGRRFFSRVRVEALKNDPGYQSRTRRPRPTEAMGQGDTL